MQGLSAFCPVSLERNSSLSPFLLFPINLFAEQAEICSRDRICIFVATSLKSLRLQQLI